MGLIITFQCPDRPGIVHAITGAVVKVGGNITELQQFSSNDTGTFFTRLEVEGPRGVDLEAAVREATDGLAAELAVHEAGRPIRTLILASKAGHCVNDLLYRWRSGELPIDVSGIMANHPVLRSLAEFYDVAFEDFHVNAKTKPAFEAEIRETVSHHSVELVVLARYMQILSPSLCEFLADRAINIHHSFLPGFKGANPYRQAHTRGVKLIGATAHFVTAELDEGPIIEQNVVRVDHSMSVAKLVQKGQAQESQTLAEAVRLFAEHRVLRDGHRTVIFR